MNMDEITPPPVVDTISQVASDASGQIGSAIDGVSGAADGIGQVVEDGITQAEEKLDGLMSGLDNFLGKF
jgi:hypothetical protein